MQNRIASYFGIAMIEIIAYALLMSIIVVESYVISIGLAAFMYFAYVGSRKLQPERVEKFRQMFLQYPKFAYILMFVILLTFPMLQAHNPYWIQVAIMVGIYISMALGLNVMVGNAGLTCLGYAAFYALGAYTYGILATRFSVDFWLALPVAAIVVMLFGLLLGLPALRVKGHYLALVTIAFGLVIYQLTLNLEPLTGGANGLMNIPSPSIFGYSFDSMINLGFMTLPFHANFYYLALVFTALTIWVLTNLSHSLTGLTWNAMREDQLAAQCYGVNLTKNKLWAFSFGAIFGGLAGALYASMVGFIAPENFTYTHSILILSMILLGGMDSIPGVIFGAMILTIVPEKFQALADYRMMFYGIVVVLILLFKNDGLIPAHTRKFTSQWVKKRIKAGEIKNAASQTTNVEPTE